MARRILFKPTETAGGWRLSVPPKLTESGKRERHFFRTQALALAAAKDLKAKVAAFGNQTRAISPTLAEQATKAAELLAPFGITVLEAAERVASAERATAASVPIETAVALFQAAKEGKSDKQTQAIRHVAAHLLEDFAGRKLSGITGKEVGAHIERRTRGPAAFNGKLRILVTFWRWCAREPRQWCAADTLSNIERAETVAGEVGILSADEAKRLLATAEKYLPETVPAFAIAMFTGMRQQEIERLESCDVTSEGITVPAANAKTKRRRFIQMPEPLAAWLKVYPVGASIVPANWERKEKAVRRLAGWRVWSDLAATINKELTPEPPEDAPEWPQNALRHTAASVALALGKPLETLIFEHGHAGGVEMLRRHYIGRMPKAEALKIWSTGPKGKKLPKLKVA